MAWFGLSAAFFAAAKSRRPRLDAVDPNHLMPNVRRVFFYGNLNEHSVDHLVRLVRYLAARGCDEAYWLLSMLTSEGAPPGAVWSEAHRKWLHEVVAACDDCSSPRALYYRSYLARGVLDFDQRSELLKQAADGGFAPAMSAYAFHVTDEERLSWYRKAAALHDAEALCELTRIDGEPNRFARHLEAANNGNAWSMGWLSMPKESKLSAEQCCMWNARWGFYSGGERESDDVLDKALERMCSGACFQTDVRVVHVVGRELEGIEQVWPNEPAIGNERHCVDFYLAIRHTARRAALQTVVAMRLRGLPKPLCMIIAKLVYNTRDDAVTWVNGAQKKPGKGK